MLISGLLSQLLLTVYNFFYNELPLLNCLINLAVAVGGSCIWVLVNSVRIGIVSGSLEEQGGHEDVEIFQDVTF